LQASRVILSATLLFCASSAGAEQRLSHVPPGDESANFQTQVVLADLNNPAGMALPPVQAKGRPFELYIAESGAGRVVRVSVDALAGDKLPGEQLRETDDVIVDFPLGTFGQQPEYRVGPLGLAFISRSKLVVSAKGKLPGADVLACYSLPVDGTVLAADEPDHAVGPLNPKIASQVDDLQISGLAVADQTLFSTSGGRDSQGWLLKSGLDANRLDDLRAFVEMQKAVGFGAPAGIALIPQPRPAFVVVSLMGSREQLQDSRLAFLVPATGKLALDLPTGLHDIISLAYSPSGQLYAADFSYSDPQAGGVYRIDDARLEGRQACHAVKVASMVRPVCLAFAPDGSLFVTSFGPGENAKQGALHKIVGAL
jgi:hypothetical protein